VTIKNSVVSGNTAASTGGGIFNEGTHGVINNGAVKIIASTITNNFAQDGGGVVNGDFAKLTISNSTIADNIGIVSGGEVENLGTASITGSTISNSIFGLGILIENPDSYSIATISNCTIYGGIVASSLGTTEISFSTLFGDSTYPGGLAGPATVKNSIIESCGMPVTALGLNLSADFSCGNNEFIAVPLQLLNLGPLTLNAPGTTPTQALLQGGSLAIDAAVGCTDVSGSPDDGSARRSASGRWRIPMRYRRVRVRRISEYSCAVCEFQCETLASDQAGCGQSELVIYAGIGQQRYCAADGGSEFASRNLFDKNSSRLLQAEKRRVVYVCGHYQWRLDVGEDHPAGRH
jgi:hypothetical protein